MRTDKTIRRSTVGFRSERGAVLAALMLTTGLVAIDATILATAVPSIVAELGEFDQFPWLFSVYLLAQAVAVPIYSKLADTIGRKPVMLAGIGLFLLGSALAGMAPTMTILIACRVVQGLGAGASAPMAMTIIGDIYTVEERAVVQGYIASVWAMASVVGPALGGVFSQFASWRWIFLVNIPLCLLAGWALMRSFHEQIQTRRHRIDVGGAAALMLGLSAVILGLLEGGNAWPWLSIPSLATFVVGVGALAVFVAVERRAVEPVLNLDLLRRSLILTTTLVSLGVGALLIGITSFVPSYLQTSLGVVPIVAGAAVAALTLGWPLSSSISGRVYLRWGFRTTVLLGAGITLVGTTALALVGPTPNVVAVGSVAFLIGFGLGWTAAPSLIAAQASVHWDERGVVTGLTVFARSAGSAVGVAILGAIANHVIAAGQGDHDASTIIHASTWVFRGVAILAALTFLAALRMPRGAVDSAAFAPAAREPEPCDEAPAASNEPA